jgi:hypothetical protein
MTAGRLAVAVSFGRAIIGISTPALLSLRWGGVSVWQTLRPPLFHNPVPSELRKTEKKRFSLVLRAKTGSWQGLGHRIVECCFINTGARCELEKWELEK